MTQIIVNTSNCKKVFYYYYFSSLMVKTNTEERQLRDIYTQDEKKCCLKELPSFHISGFWAV